MSFWKAKLRFLLEKYLYKWVGGQTNRPSLRIFCIVWSDSEWMVLCLNIAAETHKHKHTFIHTYRQTNTQTDTDRHTQTYRRTDSIDWQAIGVKTDYEKNPLKPISSNQYIFFYKFWFKCFICFKFKIWLHLW